MLKKVFNLDAIKGLNHALLFHLMEMLTKTWLAIAHLLSLIQGILWRRRRFGKNKRNRVRVCRKLDIDSLVDVPIAVCDSVPFPNEFVFSVVSPSRGSDGC